MANVSTLRPLLIEALQDPVKLRAFISTYLASLRQMSPRRLRVIAVVAFLLVGSCTGIAGQALLDNLNTKKSKKKVPLHRMDSAVKLSDGSKQIVVPYKEGQTTVTIKPTKQVTFEAHRRLFLRPDDSEGGEAKSGINGRFLRQFSALWVIMVPRLQSRESLILLVHALFLFLRTWISLLVAKLDGQIVRDMIAGDGRKFLRGLGYWFAIAVPASYTNAVIKYLQAKLSLAFRTRLTRYVHDLYLDADLAYYKIADIDGGNVGTSADQFITTDLARFCDKAAALYSNLGKPFVDFLIFTFQLSKNLGPMALIGIFANYGLTAYLLRRLAPSFGKLAAIQAKLEGEYRAAHSKLITNAEEIAFYDGTSLERTILEKAYIRLARHIRGIYRIKIFYNMFEDIILKYTWSAIGYMFASLPVFLPAWTSIKEKTKETTASAVTASMDFSEQDHMRDFITNKRLMLSLADAGGRMMYSIKDLAELSGYTSRVYMLLSVLHRVHARAYTSRILKTPIKEAASKEAKEEGIVIGEKPDPDSSSELSEEEQFTLNSISGTIQPRYPGVRFEGVPIVAPSAVGSGELLVRDLNVLIKPGEHILISGPNGCGKSAVARVIGGLWPVYRGLLSRPDISEIGFLPQRAYLSIGSLRDQIIYPDSHADMISKNVTDADLQTILDRVHLGYLPSREGGWNTRKEWKDVFSGGEKQRVMFARILYHRPKFAVIDEGTAAVSSDVEGSLYENCKKDGITLITISHRPSLMKYHKAQLKLGLGNDGKDWDLEIVGSKEARLSVEKEIQSLEEKLSKVDEWKKRKTEVEAILRGEVKHEQKPGFQEIVTENVQNTGDDTGVLLKTDTIVGVGKESEEEDVKEMKQQLGSVVKAEGDAAVKEQAAKELNEATEKLEAAKEKTDKGDVKVEGGADKPAAAKTSNPKKSEKK
ncbi:ABC transporter transmembrane region 2-domain-containing protein [Yarrowia lipolytica]|jgi:ATP-binding cassette subfamily D (ALD) long-chain fatty acid import protein|uniref:YALI0A06655p n=1 Tax=Yarrowia lipolytica (strain CLIB 122 / E 150) TaxID=284591 RepID=Q6CHP7_YARLI|nr:YALI0A06655p [Yarrowia lipolytica CLIB122]QNP95590.1 Peroxisomal long-chain fatty acid import protein 2 [Yarrowia lipolytica]RDW31552.1 ABC transporter transmembrane region 2-domain-containing protein [Yarrowia lipolytica]RDW40567.1 ABC transporter transmembrane region 2-domain-containing protein [Yarrowia lipolytica]RDW44375.1 ABC transporter transmembrane region 2-domain-containing protein [Yarrowia lipolytica]RDW51249.1 ABC transporter transmembrane region 2-domain-containing protein [Ya|eukprot:XP_499814.1 YALI0A06655p [Yarrowia lipolytica CLIB122]